MNMSTDIRVYIDKKYENIYDTLKEIVINDMHELFFISVCVGKSKNLTPCKSEQKMQKFWSKTFTTEEWTTFYAIYLKDNDMDFSTLENDQDVINAMQEYANAGLHYILKNYINDYVLKTNGIITIYTSNKEDLIKAFLCNLYEPFLGE